MNSIAVVSNRRFLAAPGSSYVCYIIALIIHKVLQPNIAEYERFVELAVGGYLPGLSEGCETWQDLRSARFYQNYSNSPMYNLLVCFKFKKVLIRFAFGIKMKGFAKPNYLKNLNISRPISLSQSKPQHICTPRQIAPCIVVNLIIVLKGSECYRNSF